VRNKSGDPSATDEEAQFIFEEWDRRARSSAADTLDLYTDDATLESPLVPRILAVESGLLRGKDAIGEFFAEGIRRRSKAPVRWYRSGEYLWDGHTLSWEYLRATPDGEQVDIAEYMQLRGPRIAAHRIYWGWFGTEMLIANAKLTRSWDDRVGDE
jgi:hypothetical protein